jgi:hypothetical protein
MKTHHGFEMRNVISIPNEHLFDESRLKIESHEPSIPPPPPVLHAV